MKSKSVAWFCVRSQIKQEHIASAHLKKLEGVEVFLPRIRFKRVTRRGSVWVKEALFPGYLFVKFDWQQSFRQVQAVAGVQGIVHFGQNWPTISQICIDKLREVVGKEELHTINQGFEPGDAVRIAEGTFRGLSAIVSRIMPGHERIAVLLEILGQQTITEVKAGTLLKEGDERAMVLHQMGHSSP